MTYKTSSDALETFFLLFTVFESQYQTNFRAFPFSIFNLHKLIA